MQATRRILLCRLGFVLLSVLPTVAVGGWLLARVAGGFSTADKTEWERELTERIGLIAKVEAVRYPRPGLAELAGLRLLDPETQNVVAEAQRLEIAATADDWQVAATQLVLQGDRLGHLSRSVEQRVLQGPFADQNARSLSCVHFAPCDILVRSEEREQTLNQFSGDIQLSANIAKVELRWRFPGEVSELDSVRFIATRDRAHSPPFTRYQVVTGKNVVPCRLAAAFLPELSGLGRECQFSGNMDLINAPHGVTGQFAGRLTHVDLDSLITERFPHQLSGLATVTIEQGLIEGGKITEMRGSIQASDGAISRSFIVAAARHLGLNAAGELADGGSAALVPFRQLGIDFHVTGNALVLGGSADPRQEGVLLANAAGSILTAPPQHSVAAVNLLRTMLPDNQYQVPATRQTAVLLRLLPVPDVLIGKGNQGPPSHTPTRLMPATLQPPQAAVRQPVLR